MGQGRWGSRTLPPPRYRYISKETSTRFYIAAWVVWIIAVIAFAIARQHVASSNPFLPTDPNLGGLATIVEILAVVMAILWIGALVRLARQHDWGWFLAVLLLQLVGLGIVGMGAYAVAGPVDIDLSKPGIT